MGVFGKIESIGRKAINAVFGYCYFLLKTSSNYKLSNKGRYALINLDGQFANFDMGRFFYTLSKYCEKAGFNVIVKTDRNYFRRISRYKKPLLREKFVFVKSCATPLDSVVLVTPGRERNLIRLKHGYDLIKDTRLNCMASFPLHPVFYMSYPSPEALEKFRDTNRKVLVFFSGNSDPEKYQKSQLKDLFNVNSRIDVLNFVKSKYGDSNFLEIISDKTVLYAIVNTNDKVKPFIISEAKSHAEDWLKILSNCTFFLCAPGVYIPWCHNLSEAMSVGTIPILEYAHLCYPPLVHLENCLAFTGLNGLEESIEMACKLSPEMLDKMKRNVIQYYEDHVSLESNAKKINDFTASTSMEITVGVPYIPAV